MLYIQLLLLLIVMLFIPELITRHHPILLEIKPIQVLTQLEHLYIPMMKLEQKQLEYSQHEKNLTINTSMNEAKTNLLSLVY